METQSEYGLALNLSRVHDLTKAEIKRLTAAVVTDVENGNQQGLLQFLLARKISELADSLLTELKPFAVNEAALFGKGDRNLVGCEFNVVEPSPIWDYSNIAAWNEIQNRIADLELQIKSLKAVQTHIETCALNGLTDVNTGEVYSKPNPASNPKKPYLVVKIK